MYKKGFQPICDKFKAFVQFSRVVMDVDFIIKLFGETMIFQSKECRHW